MTIHQLKIFPGLNFQGESSYVVDMQVVRREVIAVVDADIAQRSSATPNGSSVERSVLYGFHLIVLGTVDHVDAGVGSVRINRGVGSFPISLGDTNRIVHGPIPRSAETWL